MGTIFFGSLLATLWIMTYEMMKSTPYTSVIHDGSAFMKNERMMLVEHSNAKYMNGANSLGFLPMTKVRIIVSSTVAKAA